MPLSRLEADAGWRLPRRDVPLVLYDNGEGLADTAAQWLIELGYSRVHRLAGDLAAHHVQVTATAAATSSSLTSVLIGLLPLLLIGGVVYFVIHRARRQAAGG